MEIDRLAADSYRLGDKSLTGLRKCVIIVTGTSAGHVMEYRMLYNNPADLIGEIEDIIVGKQYNRLPKAATGLEGYVGIEGHHSKGKKRRPRIKFNGNRVDCGKNGHYALKIPRSRKRVKHSELRAATRRV